MRLTKKLDKPIETKYLHYDYMRIGDYDISKGNYGRITDAEIYNKLGQLEDIEEELGIDLITLFKAIKKGCFVKEKFDYMGRELTQIVFTKFTYFYYADDLDAYLVNIRNKDYYLKDYGKTWALTKEELL